MNFYRFKILNFIILISVFFSVFNFDMVFSKKLLEDGYVAEVDMPVAEEDSSVSQGIIKSGKKIEIVNPLNPTPSIAENMDEYNRVNNYNISLETIPLRIKYFAPTYKYAVSSAENTIRTQLYIAGGSENTVSTLRDTLSDLPAEKKKLKLQYEELNMKLNLMKQAGLSDTDSSVLAIKTGISQVQIGIGTIDLTTGQLHSAVSGYNKALMLMKNVSNNSQIVRVRNLLSRSMSSAFLSYKQLEFYEKILVKQVDLYDKIYKLYIKNRNMGLATTQEVEKHRLNLMNTRDTLKSTRTTMRNVKELIAINLGYSLRDMNKLKFIEPEVDENYVNGINFDTDKEMAYYSHTDYDNIRKKGENKKKLPESTSKYAYTHYIEAVKQKIIAGLELKYKELTAMKLRYKSSGLQSEILNLNRIATENKKENDLLSESEYLGLLIQNLATEMEIKTSKYNYITAINDYYFGTYGFIDIE